MYCENIMPLSPLTQNNQYYVNMAVGPIQIYDNRLELQIDKINKVGVK